MLTSVTCNLVLDPSVLINFERFRQFHVKKSTRLRRKCCASFDMFSCCGISDEGLISTVIIKLIQQICN